MKKIIIILAIILTIYIPSQASALGSLSYFEDAVNYAHFMRIYLGVCPEIERSGDISSHSSTTIPKNKRDIAAKICTSEIKADVQRNLKFLIAINIYGSIDLKRPDYNLPGAKIEDIRAEFKDDATKVLSFSTTIYKTIGLFNRDTWHLLVDRSKSENTNVTNLLNNINEADLQLAVEKIFQSCESINSTDFKLCNDLLNIQEPDKNHNIFNPYNLNSIYLQQMFFNMHTNATNGADAIPVNIPFKTFNDEFRRNILQPTLDFGNNFNFNFSEIQPDRTALSKVKTHFVPGGSGFIIDQFAEMATRAAEGMYTSIATWFLNIRLETISDPSVKEVWQAFRNIANIIFIIMFLVVIISQISNIGLSNYAIKRMLPKLIIAVMLVNLSFYITQAVIDMSNLLGKGVYQLLVDTSKISGGFMDQYGVYTSKQGEIGDILNILLLIVAGFLAIIATLINILLLTIRDAIVIILIITSPFALVSGLSPQMQKLHDTWWKMLFNMASIYPITSFLVGGAILVDQIIMSGQDGMIMFLTAKLALFGSLVVIPFIILNAMRKIDSAIKVGGTGSIMNIPFVFDIGPDPVSTGLKTKKLFDKTGIGRLRAEQKQQRRLIKRASRTGQFWTRASLNAQHQLSKQRTDFAKNFNQSEAEELINNLYYGNDSFSSAHLRIKYNNFYNKGTNPKEIALALAMSYAQDNDSQRQSNPENILKAMNVARQNGATQAELHDATTNIIKKLDEKGDFRSLGILNANFEYNQSYGKLNSKLLHQADQLSHTISDSTVKKYHDLITKHTGTAMKDKGLFNKLQSGNMENLTPQTIPKGTVANEIFIQYLQNNPSTRDTLIENYHKLSAETQQLLGVPTQLLSALQRPPHPTPNTQAQSSVSQVNIGNQPSSPNNLQPSGQQRIQQLRQQYQSSLADEERKYRQKYAKESTNLDDPDLARKARDYAQNKLQPLFDEIHDAEEAIEFDIAIDDSIISQSDHKSAASDTTSQAYDSLEAIKQSIIDSIKANNDIK